MSESNKKDIELIISEETNKLTEIVNYKIEQTLTQSSELIKPMIEQVTTTVVSNTTEITIKKKTVIELISESSLTQDQKNLANNTYEIIIPSIKDLITDKNINLTVKITYILSQIIKYLENTKLDNYLITGVDKKQVTIQLGRILIKELITDDKDEIEVLALYDMVAEPTLEAMIDVSKVVNVVAKEITTRCCPSLLTLFKK
jgi:hypothetical protein